MPSNAGGLRFARQVSEAKGMPYAVMNMLELIHAGLGLPSVLSVQ